MNHNLLKRWGTAFLCLCLISTIALAKPKPKSLNLKDGKNRTTGKPDPPRDPELAKYGIYAQTAPRAKITKAHPTRLPLQLKQGDRIALIGNTLLERSQFFGHIETLLHPRDLAAAIVEPSLAIDDKFRNRVFVLRDGQAIIGQVVWNAFRKGVLHVATDPKNFDLVTEINKNDVLSHEISDVSPMPTGLLNTLDRDEILDLIAFLGSSGPRVDE